MDSDNHLRVVDSQRITVCPANESSVLCYTVPTRPADGRIYPVRGLLYDLKDVD